LAYLIDIDGTLMNTNVAHEGASELIHEFNSDNTKYLLMTNSIKNPDVQLERLRNAGIEVRNNSIINPIIAINRYLADNGFSTARIIGTKEEIIQVEAINVENSPEIVVLLDFEKGNKTYNDLQNVIDDIESGITVIAASISPYYFKSGKKIIDTGAFVSLIEDVSGKKVINFGKPSRSYFDIAASIINEETQKIFVIGDDWSTDIKGANNWGAKSILVKSGKYVEGDEEREIPSLLVNNLIDIKRNHRTIAST
jgi:HAD superfamily hydrolase (TIGR01450 family)